MLVKGTGSEQGTAQRNEMGAPRVPGNFVTTPPRPALHLRGTKAKGGKGLVQSLTQPDRSGWDEGGMFSLPRAIYLGWIRLCRLLCTSREQHEDTFVELMTVCQATLLKICACNEGGDVQLCFALL